MHVRLLSSAAVIAGLIAGPAAAQAAVGKDEPTVLEEITVTATRTAQAVDEVPATVSVITAREIEANLVADIGDLVRWEPGVEAPSGPARFGAAFGGGGRDGNAGFNIRGLEGNRVLIQTDGVRLPDAYAYGRHSSGVAISSIWTPFRRSRSCAIRPRPCTGRTAWPAPSPSSPATRRIF